ncbi:serine protease 54 [Phyllostomus discolor]|uniref:Inactive serine protease 54 n=2 Tax=Phyllostomus discolor TaxID=89673 RepID=A0A834DGL1_9CHIR|nr:serine protease 54 [Phyllostomus discolor]
MAGTARMLLVLLCVAMPRAATSCGVQKASITEDSEEGLVSENEFPWVVSLQDSHHTHLAFGSILSEFWILSIASAFQHRPFAVAVVGIASMDARVLSHEEYPVSTIILHEDFDEVTMTNNLALLKTDTAMQFSGLVRSVCYLGTKLHVPLALRNCWVAGWNPTFATGNHMTMSILRKISMNDLDQCPFPTFQKTGCGDHVAGETDSVCLGDPGNPLMCQLQKSYLWVLRGILTEGGERCPGLLVYVKVEDYSDWIESKTRTSGLPLSAVYHWENTVPVHGYSPHATVEQKTHSGLSQVTWTETQLQTQESTTAVTSEPENSSEESEESRGEEVRETSSLSEAAVEEATQPEYFDYYQEQQAGEDKAVSGQDRLPEPREMVLFAFVFSFVVV